MASPAAEPNLPLPASDLVGGSEYIGMVKLLPGTQVPAGWLPCDGQLLPVAEHPALAAMLGNLYGGDAHTTLALPKLHPTPAGPNAASGADLPAFPAFVAAIKVANAPTTALSSAGQELRLTHHRRTRRA